LGSARWNFLHRLVYGIAVLGAVHFFIQSKLNIYQPVLMAGLLTWLLAYRGLFRRNGEVTPLQLLLLAVAAAAVTAVGEALIYMFTSGVDARRVLLAHFDVDAEVRPAWWVLAAGLAVAALAFWRQKPARQRASRRRISPSAMSGATQVQSGS
jgi:sulfoxide reductase heme-binding subunit YedZ